MKQQVFSCRQGEYRVHETDFEQILTECHWREIENHLHLTQLETNNNFVGLVFFFAIFVLAALLFGNFILIGGR